MKATGNGTPQQCVANLLKTMRGEVPYERLKGLDPGIIDQPSATAGGPLQEDVGWLVRTYEPRTSLQEVELQALAAQAGNFMIEAAISDTEGGE